MLRAMAASVNGVSGLLPGLLMKPALADIILRLLGERGRLFDPLFHDFVSPTILQGSDKINVIPGRVYVELDGRLLQGFQPGDLIASE
jgi:acetylornithine deacetylase/succinyl-diaminopimelate desuccinylase-like protein